MPSAICYIGAVLYHRVTKKRCKIVDFKEHVSTHGKRRYFLAVVEWEDGTRSEISKNDLQRFPDKESRKNSVYHQHLRERKRRK